jgi:hypothetical protein
MLQTIINEDELDKWCEKLPHLNTFLEGFFMTKIGMSVDYICAEYFRRIEQYQELKVYERELSQAFAEIVEPEYRVDN